MPAARPLDYSAPTKGEPYVNPKTRHELNSIWKHFIGQLLKKTKMTERFAAREIRARLQYH